jgi:hypothetical protein
MLRLNSSVPPGTRLHLLAVGISAYNEDYAKSLRLHYADRDANDLANAISNTQGSLYTVVPHLLVDKDANKLGIMRVLALMRSDMEKRPSGGAFLRSWGDGGRQAVSPAAGGRCPRPGRPEGNGLVS